MGGRDSGTTVAQYEEVHEVEIKVTEAIIGNCVTFEARDGVKLSGYWHENDDLLNAPAVILFHGNNGDARMMLDWGDYYKNLGFSVLMVEYRGYALSEGVAGGPNQELEAYLDAEASLQFILSKEIPKKNILVHGFSLGGAYAAALGYFYGVEHIILDHTFTTLGSICAKWFPFASWDNRIASSYVRDTMNKHPQIPGAQDLATDGFNTLSKVQKMNGKVFVICGKNDRMMPARFAEEIMQARYPDNLNTRQNSFVMLEGGHNYPFNLFEGNEEAIQKHWAFLVPIGKWNRLKYSGLVNLDLLCAQDKSQFQDGDRGFYTFKY